MTHIGGPDRDFIGYGQHAPQIEWPNGARVAVSLCMNYEEGAERSILDGDERNEWVGEISYTPEDQTARDLSQESVYEYGSRAGIWRLMRLFDRTETRVTFYAAAQALQRNPALARQIIPAGHEVSGHGLRWVEPTSSTREQERDDIARAVEIIEETTGEAPRGWYSRYAPSVNTRELLIEHGGFSYDSDAYNDDIPYWVMVKGKRHLVVPYTHTYNDGRFAFTPGYSHPGDFFENCRRGIQYLIDEGETHPRMMSIGLHARLVGQAGRTSALADLIEWANSTGAVWFARRGDIADWFTANYSDTPTLGGGS
ncbi:polysaccharide deacetylase family protein [Microbacterium sp. SLBN-146]|uniref:polysaccharide deacetylase family protein n=1 Tax=Microbacterium sp. SLBN-146 TaxID=2768457 RepID=UPI00114FEF07|nr:polysaccharide deacetylase family protein [Microbacterium sp. SLBN-146]TQJ30736.1 peptidoglycan/xylan/chitin deacetylase (PgdA/CDA1 family) [Microbacterium sp. SLBN-146]